MQVQVLSISPPRKQGVLAHASVTIELEGQTVTVSDLRVLQNRSGQLWLGMPSYSIPNGRNFRYEQSVELSRELKRAVEDAVLTAYERWAAQQAALMQGGPR